MNHLITKFHNLLFAIKKVHPFIWFALFAVVSHWQIAFFQYGLKAENIDQVLPWRYFVSNCLQKGIFPFWNPYQQGGYPIYADFRSVFNPEVWLLGSSTGYSIVILHAITVIYIFIAGVSSFRLMNHVLINRKIATIGGTIYMLSGFVVQHGYDLPKLIAASWLPFSLLFFIRLFQQPSLKNSMLSALFFYLLFASGYLPISLILTYVVLGLGLYNVLHLWKEKNKAKILNILFFSSISVILISILILPQIISYFQVSDWIYRFGGLSLYEGEEGHFPVKALVSFILPLSTVKDYWNWNTEIGMRNIYIGIIPLVFFIFALISKKPKTALLTIISGILLLIASFGPESFLHKILFEYFPLLDLFRYPSFYNLFTSLFFIIVAVWGFRQYFNTGQVHRKKLLVVILSITAVVACFVVWAFTKQESFFKGFISASKPMSKRIEGGSLFDHIIFQGSYLILVLVGLLVLLTVFRNSKYVRHYVLILLVGELILSTQVQGYFTMIDFRKAVVMQREINRQTESFLLPDVNVNIGENTDGLGIKQPFVKNTNIFKKKVSYDGENSFELIPYTTLNTTYPSLRDEILDHPILYASTNVKKISELDSVQISKHVERNVVYIPDSLTEYIDTAVEIMYSVRPIKFSPNEMIFDISLDTTGAVILLQSYFPGWSLYIDNEKTEIFPANIQFIGTILKSGTHRIEFRYNNPPVYKAWIVSFILFLVLVAVLLLIHYSGNKRIFSFLVYTATLSMIAGLATSQNEVNEKSKIDIANAIRKFLKSDNYYVIVNSDRPEVFSRKFNSVKNMEFVRLDSERKLHDYINTFSNPDKDTLVVMNIDLEMPYSLIGFFERNFKLVDQKLKNHFQLYYLIPSDVREESFFYNFDWLPEFWKKDSIYIVEDSSQSNRFFFIKADRPYYFETVFDNAKLPYTENIIFHFNARIQKRDSSNLYLAIMQERNGEHYFWHDYNLTENCKCDTSWYYISHSVDLPQEILPGDKLKSIIWNRDQGNIYIDDILVQIAPYKLE